MNTFQYTVPVTNLPVNLNRLDSDLNEVWSSESSNGMVTRQLKNDLHFFPIGLPVISAQAWSQVVFQAILVQETPAFFLFKNLNFLTYCFDHRKMSEDKKRKLSHEFNEEGAKSSDADSGMGIKLTREGDEFWATVNRILRLFAISSDFLLLLLLLYCSSLKVMATFCDPCIQYQLGEKDGGGFRAKTQKRLTVSTFKGHGMRIFTFQ